MTNKKVTVIGGGPSGMIAAGFAAAKGHTVTLFEKNGKLGRKLMITGKGRCNLTNAVPIDELIDNVPGNPYFLYSAFNSFDSGAVMDFFQELGVELKVERGNRVFPVSDRAADVVDALRRFMAKKRVDVRLGAVVSGLQIDDAREIVDIKDVQSGTRRVSGVVDRKGGIHLADAVIIATGGMSYPATGSTGDGYALARQAGHTVVPLRPSLTPLVAEEHYVRQLQGLSLKNAGVAAKVGGKTVFGGFGELMFTHFGVSGPVILTMSRAIIDLIEQRPVLSIDLKPALSAGELDDRVLRDFSQNLNRDFANSLDDLLPRKMIDVCVARSGIPPRKKVRDITKKERGTLVSLLKDFTLTVCGSRGFEEAVVTCGGVNVNEINPKTMGSKRLDGLYFAGEVIDVDGYTGGFNLQIAFATGFLAGNGV